MRVCVCVCTNSEADSFEIVQAVQCLLGLGQVLGELGMQEAHGERHHGAWTGGRVGGEGRIENGRGGAGGRREGENEKQGGIRTEREKERGGGRGRESGTECEMRI